VQLTWTDIAKDVPCPVCGGLSDKPIFVTALDHRFYSCTRCASLVCVPICSANYAHDDLSTVSLHHYVQVGSNFEFLIGNIATAVDKNRRGNFLDVGCGFGFGLHAVSSTTSWSVLGIEPAPYGQVGARLLNVPVRPTLLQDAPDVPEGHFDVVHSSEVLEHVQDPLSFLRTLGRYLTADGTIVLTTPNAEFIQCGQSPNALLSCLNPGEHVFLTSPGGLESLIRSAGFDHVTIDSTPQNLIAFASRAPLRLNRAGSSWMYEAALKDLVRTLPISDPIWTGPAYRLLGLLSIAGRFAEADQLLGTILARWPLDMASIENTREFSDFGAKVPFCWPGIGYHAGIINMLFHKDLLTASRFFEEGFQAANRMLELEPRYGDEARMYYWVCLFHHGLSLAVSGQMENAAKIFTSILDQQAHPAPQAHIPPVDPMMALRAADELAKMNQPR